MFAIKKSDETFVKSSYYKNVYQNGWFHGIFLGKSNETMPKVNQVI